MKVNITLGVVVTVMLMSSCADMNKQDKAGEEPTIDTGKIEKEITEKTQLVVWALNNNNPDSLMKDFWNSDSARFILNGRSISGYEAIGNGLSKAMSFRKSMNLQVTREEVMVLSPTAAIHIAAFDNEVVDVNDSSQYNRGAWSAVYRHMNDDWKVVLVHESFYPIDEQGN